MKNENDDANLLLIRFGNALIGFGMVGLAIGGDVGAVCGMAAGVGLLVLSWSARR